MGSMRSEREKRNKYGSVLGSRLSGLMRLIPQSGPPTFFYFVFRLGLHGPLSHVPCKKEKESVC